MGKRKFKWDKARIDIAFLTIVFALFFRMLTHTWLRTANFSLSAYLSPVLGLLVAQWLIERRLDWKETGIFALTYTVMINVTNFLPALSQYDIFAIQMNTASGVLFSAGVYFVVIPISVLISDWITDRMG